MRIQSIRLRNKLIPLLLVATVSAAVHGESALWPHSNSDIPVDERAQWHVLGNGLRVVLYPWQEPEEHISLRLVVEAGSLHETDAQKGLAHFIEHMAFNGTRNFSPGEMVRYFQRLGMDWGPDTNAHTWWRETVYKLELPRNTDSMVDDGLQLLRDYADGMLFDPEEIEKERGVILAEMRDRASPQYTAYREGLKFALPESLMPDRLPIGDREIIQTAPREQFLEFYETWYRPDRMVVIAVGDFNPAEMLAEIEGYFASMENPEDPAPEIEIGTLDLTRDQVRVFSHPGLSRASLEMYVRRAIERTPPTMEKWARDWILNLANGTFNRRLSELALAADSVILGGSGYDYRWLDFVRYSGVQVNADMANWEAALQLAENELRRALEFGFRAADFETARSALVTDLRQAASEAPARKSREISSAIVRAIIDNTVVTDPEVRRDLWVPFLEGMDLPTVESAFVDAWQPEKRLTFISGRFGETAEATLLAAREMPVDPLEEKTNTGWAYTDFGPSHEIVEDRWVEDLEIRQLRFANNLHASLKQTNFEEGSIDVVVRFGSGKAGEPEDKPGLAAVTETLLPLGGLGSHSYFELTQLLAPYVLGISFSADMANMVARGTTNEEDLLLQLQVFAAFLTDPAFSEDAVSIYHRLMGPQYEQSRTTPFGIKSLEVDPYLAGGDFTFYGMAPREVAFGYTMEDVRQWIQGELRRGFLEVAIVGDFKDPDRVVKWLAQTLGALDPREKRAPDTSRVSTVRYAGGSPDRVFTYQSDQEQALALAYYGSPEPTTIEERRRLGLLAAVVTNRMQETIREDSGAAYSAYASSFTRYRMPHFAFLQLYASVESGVAETALAQMRKIAADLRENGLTEDELVRVIEPQKKDIEEYRRTNAYWSNNVLSESWRYGGESLEWARSFEDFWDQVTLAEMNALAKSHFDPDSELLIQVVPVN